MTTRNATEKQYKLSFNYAFRFSQVNGIIEIGLHIRLRGFWAFVLFIARRPLAARNPEVVLYFILIIIIIIILLFI